MVDDINRNRVATSYKVLPGSTDANSRDSRDHEPIRDGILRFTVKFDDFQPDATAGPKTITLFAPDATIRVRDVWLNLVTTFEGGTISTADIEIGESITPDVDAYIAALGVGVAQSLGFRGLTNAEKGAMLATPNTPITTGVITITLTVAGDVIDALSQGELLVWVAFQEFDYS